MLFISLIASNKWYWRIGACAVLVMASILLYLRESSGGHFEQQAMSSAPTSAQAPLPTTTVVKSQTSGNAAPSTSPDPWKNGSWGLLVGPAQPLNQNDRKLLTKEQQQEIAVMIGKLESALNEIEAGRGKLLLTIQGVPGKTFGLDYYTIDAPSPEDIARASEAMGAILGGVSVEVKPLAREQLQRVYDEYMRFPASTRIIKLTRDPSGNNIMEAEDFFTNDVSAVGLGADSGVGWGRSVSTATGSWRSLQRRYGHIVHTQNP